MYANKISFLSIRPRAALSAVVLSSLLGCSATERPLAQIVSQPSENVASRFSDDLPVQEPLVVPVAFDGSIEETHQPITVAPELALSSGEKRGLQSPAEMNGELAILPEETLSLTDAESLALSSHPALAEAASNIEALRGQYVQAGLPFNPVLQYQSDEIGNEGSSGLHSVSVSQQFVTKNKLGIAQQVQAQAIQKQQAQLKAAELRVLTRVRSAFAQTLVAQRRVELTSQIVELVNQSIASVKSLLDAEEVSKIAWLQAQVEAEQVRLSHENAITQFQAHRRALAAAMGCPLANERLVGDITEGLTETTWEERLDEITATSPEMASAAFELERARWAHQLARAQVTPNVTGQVGVGVDTGTDDTYATVGVSVPLPIRNRNQGNLRTTRANVTAAAASIDRTRLSLKSRLAEALGRYQVAWQRYNRISNQVIPNAEETYRLSQTAFDAGETDYLQLLIAQRTLFSTQLVALESAAQAREAIADIEGFLIGE